MKKITKYESQINALENQILDLRTLTVDANNYEETLQNATAIQQKIIDIQDVTSKTVGNVIEELKSKKSSSPVIFLKPDSSLIAKNQPFFIPEFSNEIHYEIELILKFNRLGKHISKDFAYEYFDQISLGVDFTAIKLIPYPIEGIPMVLLVSAAMIPETCVP